MSILGIYVPCRRSVESFYYWLGAIKVFEKTFSFQLDVIHTKQLQLAGIPRVPCNKRSRTNPGMVPSLKSRQ